MKLYTEEQLRETWNKAYLQGMSVNRLIVLPTDLEEHLESLTPIELPSDEEISKYANFAMPDAEKIGGETYTAFKGFELGAKWMRDKIKGDK